MRWIFVGIIILSASMAVVHTAQAQKHTHGPPGYGYMQARIGHRQPIRDDPSHDDFKKIEKDDGDLDLPASQDDISGAGQVHSEEGDLTKKIEQDSERIDREIRNICPSCGAEGATP
jgi:hypothetical protein